MPGELGDPIEQPNVGHYENRYEPDPEWNVRKDFQPETGTISDKNTQIGRILRRLKNRNNKYEEQ